jgi:hypothetical protein
MVSVRTAVVIALALGALVAVGRWERSREIAAEVKGLQRIAALVGPLDQRTLTGYRVQPTFDCLVYRRGSNPFALELCADRSGRLVEAIDRRGEHKRIYSVRADPSASPIRIDRPKFEHVLHRMIREAG